MDKKLDSFSHPRVQKSFVDGIGTAFGKDVIFCFYVICCPRKMNDGSMVYEFMPVSIDIPKSFYFFRN